VAASLLAIWLTEIAPSLLEPMRFFFFWAAVMISAIAAGTGPALLALVICTVAATVIVATGQGLDGLAVARLTMFFLFALGIAWAAGARRRAYVRTAHNREWLEKLLERMHGAVIATAADGRIALLNGAAEQLVGRSANTVRGRALAEILPLDITGAAGETKEIELTRADGTRVMLDCRVTPLAAAGDGSMVIVLRDATAEREEAGRLREEAETTSRLQQFTSAFARARSLDEVGTIMTERVGSAIGARAGVVVLTIPDSETLELLATHGYEPGSIDHFLPLSVTSPFPLCSAIRNRRGAYLSSVSTMSAEFPTLVPVWQQFGSQAIVAIPLDVDGRVLGSAGWSFAEPRRFDQEDQEFLTAIAGQCALAIDRIRLLESERRAREEAETANRVRDEFLAVLSHELRTPITAIRGWVEVLQTETDPTLIKEGLDAIARSSRAQTALADELLDIARAISGKLELDLAPLDGGEVVRSVAALLGPKAAEKQITVKVDAAEQVPIMADESRLQQIIWNLLMNAIKFTDPGGSITMSARRDGDGAAIAVCDTGRGIEQSFLPHVFDRFTQASTSSEHGLGLGLAVVRHLVQAHGGRIEAASDGEGKGATFNVYLPCLERKSAEAS
jgi:PAS domain S-box-containing protein